MDLGSYVEHDGRPAVRFERTYRHPLERVWTAISESDELSHWFPCTVVLEPRAGGRVTFSGDPRTPDTTGTVLVFEPPHRLTFSWGDDELHLELRPTPDGCRLTFVDVLTERDQAARNGAGWHLCLDELGHRLAGGPGPDRTPWRPTYQAYLAAGVPSGAAIPGAPA